MLTALQTLWFGAGPADNRTLCCDMSGARVALKLPHLMALGVDTIMHGEIILSCPKLADAGFRRCASLHIVVEDASLTKLVLKDSREVQFAMSAPEKQLQELDYLMVSGCSEVGRHLIEDVGQMQNLQKLIYIDFPAAYMPESFPQSLFAVILYPSEWMFDPPRGLKELHRLEPPTFSTRGKSWDIPRSVAGLLCINSLQHMMLGIESYSRQSDGGGFAKDPQSVSTMRIRTSVL